LRSDQVQGGDAPLFDRAAMLGFVQTMAGRTRYEAVGQMAGLGSRILASLSGGAIKQMPPPLSGWTQSRHFPPFAKQSFRAQWRARVKRRQLSGRMRLDPPEHSDDAT
jgi:L-lactate dehydrogenase complex protein LldF